MSAIASTEMSNLMAAHRLMEMAKDSEARRKGKNVDGKSALEYMEEDQALISDSAKDAQKQELPALPQIENINVRLADLHENRSGQARQAQVVVQEEQSIEIEMEFSYRPNTPIEGLVVHNQRYAESDRYLFKFADGSTFTILDKWSNKSTTVWGDPHVDVSDVGGNSDGDFKDLKASDDFTTFMLMDGTRVTFKAKDAGFIEQVDIFKGAQHVKGIGSDSKEFSPETGLFSTQVQNNEAFVANQTPIGDLIFAGGDGNDWFDAGNKLIWGKTTGPIVTQRPLATLEFYYRQTVSQSISVQTISIDA